MENKYKNILIDIIHEKLPGCKIYLFGSRARGTHKSGADIDLALDIGKPIGLKFICFMQNKIDETNLPLLVDLVDLHTASEKLRKEIINEGVLWLK